MITRRAALVLVALLFTGCLEAPVTEILEIHMHPGGGSIVRVSTRLRDPSDYDRSPRVQQRLEAEARDLVNATDPWSDRIRRLDPNRQQDVVDRENGTVRGVTRSVELSGADDLRVLFS